MKKVNEQSEKITINVNHVDLGKIALLVERLLKNVSYIKVCKES